MAPACHDQEVGRRAWVLFALLSSFWGASYMFIKIGLDDGLPAPAIVFWRTALAAAVLLPIAARMGALADIRSRLAPVALIGVGIGLAGVILLLGLDTSGSAAAIVGGLMVILASLGYALGSYYLKRRFAGTKPVGIVAA